MIKRLVYNKKAFKILNSFTIKQSNAEVTFNDITIDFTGYSLLDIPFKYQELKIIQAETEEEILNENGEVVFTGFLDDIDLSEMKIRKEEQRELTLTVLSPLAMSTKRYVSLIGTYSKEEAIRRVLQPLLDDGFKIVEFNIPTGQITTNFVIESVENCMNDMCFKAGVFWFIDENKNIYINSIDYLFGLGSKKTIAPDMITKGLSKIQPKIENIDYANVINFKNVRIFYSTMSMCDELNNLIEEHDYPLLNLPKKLKKGDTVQFNNPIVVSEDTLRKLREEGEVDDADVASLSIVIGGEEFYIRIETNEKSTDYDKYVTSNNFSFSDDGGEEKTLVLQRDSFFSNLITGFKWNGADNSVVSRIYTGTALRYTTMRFMYSAEINNLKGVISDTGIVEKCIDYQEKWTTTTQLIDYARSLMSSNTKTINQVDLTFDETPNLRIGDIVEIHEPDFYIDGKFAVKEISYKYINDENEEWNIKLKNSDLNSTYIDLFRPAQKQENESKTDTVVLSEYVEETVFEKHEIGEKETLAGDVIVVKDNDGLITIEKINGSHSQKSTQGINLFNPKISTKTTFGVTVSQEGKHRIKLNGKGSGGWAVRFDTIHKFEKDKSYTVTIRKISGSVTQVSSSSKWGFLFYPESSKNRHATFMPSDTVVNGTFKAEESNTAPYIWIGWNAGLSVVGTNSVFNNLVLEISIVEGSTAKDYEDYTGCKPSPSTDYLQEVETTKDSVKIIKRNKNQLSLPEQTGTSNGVTHHFKNGTVTLQGTLTDSWCTAYSKEDFYLKKGTYSFFATNLDKQFEARMYLKNGKTQSFWLASFAWKKTVTFEADVIACYMVYHHATKGEEVNISIDIQLEAGETFSNFVVPKQEALIIPVQQEMLEGDYIDNTEHHEWGKIILTGDETWGVETTGRFRILQSNLPFVCKAPSASNILLGNLCNSYIEKTPYETFNKVQGFAVDPSGNLTIYDDNYSNNSDLAGFKAMLAEKYNAGNPVICYLKLATPAELELTDEQKAISKYLQPYDNETTILVIDKLATITASYTKSYTKKGENDEN